MTFMALCYSNECFTKMKCIVSSFRPAVDKCAAYVKPKANKNTWNKNRTNETATTTIDKSEASAIGCFCLFLNKNRSIAKKSPLNG